MNVMIIGNGGREHAIAWKISQSQNLKKLYCAPGNPGIAKFATNVPIKVDDFKSLIKFCKENDIGLTIVGPEYPLSLGIVDAFRKENLRIFGPTQPAAEIESSKSFAKEIMFSSGVSTASCEVVGDIVSAEKHIKKVGAPIVLKADGLAAGKGVFVCNTLEEAKAAVGSLFNKMKVSSVVIEELLQGNEASYIVATDGTQVVPLAASNDYKRIFDDDLGPNTGGMGTISPTPNLKLIPEDCILKEVINPVLQKMRERGIPFEGFLYAGLMISEDQKINVIEFNARLGDPETQVILRRQDGDLLELLDALTSNGLKKIPEIKWKQESAICLVLAAKGYPDAVKSGDEISGIEEAEKISDVVVFQAGTTLNKAGKLITAGGRVLNITATGKDSEDARMKAYKAAELIKFEGMQFRKDIAR